MRSTLQQRIEFFKGAQTRRWVWVVYLFFGLVGLWDTIGAQLVPPTVAEKWPTIYALAMSLSGLFPWWGWVIGALVFALFVTVEYAVRRKGPEKGSERRQAFSVLQMTVGEDGPYFGTEGGIYDIRRTFNLKLENIDRSKSLSECSIHIMEVVPPTDYEGPWLLQDGIVLAAGAHTFIPLVTYGEALDLNKYGCGDTFITTGTATGRPNLDVGPKYTVTLRATAQNTACCDFECLVWVDENGRLRIEET